jgi:hypothetical protein
MVTLSKQIHQNYRLKNERKAFLDKCTLPKLITNYYFCNLAHIHTIMMLIRYITQIGRYFFDAQRNFYQTNQMVCDAKLILKK